MRNRGVGGRRVTRAILGACLTVIAVAACAPASDGMLPSGDEILAYYESDRRMEAEVVGNVAVLRVYQDAEQLRRGGALWAKVGPYVFLFSEETHQLFTDFEGVAGVRVTTMVGSAEVASALLAHEELSDILWARSLNIAGRARLQGTNRMTLLEDLVDWGESHTEFTYNERYTKR